MAAVDADADALSFLSWNMALMARSASAPPTWGQEQTEAALRNIVLDKSPDVVLYQELPGVVPFVETHDMVRANPRSHSGNLAVLLGNHLVDEPVKATVVDGCGLLVAFTDRDLTIANVHLAPGRAGRAVRLSQLEAVAAHTATTDLVVVGDTNTRLDEEASIAGLGFAHPRPPAPTWDSRRNRFHADGPSFLGYFTRAFTSGRMVVTSQRVESGRITAERQTFHLSDHYGLFGVVERSPEAALD
jgi:endonuclease/exonuclease/phosphatase family metal-dependent hydrolase